MGHCNLKQRQICPTWFLDCVLWLDAHAGIPDQILDGRLLVSHYQDMSQHYQSLALRNVNIDTIAMMQSKTQQKQSNPATLSKWLKTSETV